MSGAALTLSMQPGTPDAQSLAPGTSDTDAEIVRRVAPSVVEIITEDGNGSGVAVANGILTSAHVVDQASSIEVADGTGQTATAAVLRIDRAADLALLESGLRIPPLEMEAMGGQQAGDQVLVLRATPGAGATSTRAAITAIGIEQDSGHAVVETDAARTPDHPGGAMVNMRGRLIGIPMLRRSDADEVLCAVPMDTVVAFLQAPRDTVAPPAPAPIFRGDPRTIALSADDLGRDRAWELVATDTTHLADGLFGEQFVVEPGSDPAVTIVVGVLRGIRTAVDQWPALAAPSDASFVEYPIEPMGDASYGAVSAQKQTLSVSARAKNVLVSVEVTSAGYLTDAGLATRLLAHMVARVEYQTSPKPPSG